MTNPVNGKKSYKMSYWYKDNNEWRYHSEVVLANSPQEVKFPSNVHLYMPQVELYDQSR
jgi:hypothetical protein